MMEKAIRSRSVEGKIVATKISMNPSKKPASAAPVVVHHPNRRTELVAVPSRHHWEPEATDPGDCVIEQVEPVFLVG